MRLYLAMIQVILNEMLNALNCFNIWKRILKHYRKLIFNRMTHIICWHIIYFVLIRLESHKQELGYYKGSIKNHKSILTCVAQLVEHCPTKQKVPGSIPSQSTCLGCRPVPIWGVCARGNQIDVSLTHWCFFPSASPSLALSLKINKQNIFEKSQMHYMIHNIFTTVDISFNSTQSH